MQYLPFTNIYHKSNVFYRELIIFLGRPKAVRILRFRLKEERIYCSRFGPNFATKMVPLINLNSRSM